MVDQRAQRLAYEAFLNEYGLGKTVEHCFDVALAEYEAAKWRPIEEAPRDGTEIFVYVHGYTFQPGLVSWKGGGWLEPGRDTWDDYFLMNEGAMFRTIDPPKQDAVSRATSAPPAAEASS